MEYNVNLKIMKFFLYFPYRTPNTQYW